MYFTILTTLLASSTSASPTFWPITQSTSTPCHSQAISPQWHDTIVSNWQSLWAGDLIYLNQTVTPNINLLQDRFPDGNGSEPLSINNSTALLNFVRNSREGFRKYEFRDLMHFGADNLVAFRWTMEGVYAGGLPGAMAKNGTVITYNGTDIMTLDRCTGLIAEVQSSQDFITYFHELRMDIGKV
ncbi:hypothetical protein LTR70_008824 [Exophiala xenobiotica]|uniref:Uncharacterized protein n=1 Tax=Lithohypha guttulata TaxID=1690604 RepID=A0ABR0JWL1_9EURO|nr:hypothetical protein LTR24_010167 [Lithohypha guttulata]KAK5311402.1 hypothetical protein LTR70_008824 [Exophiala xenobiotica]